MPLPYLADPSPWSLDLELEVTFNGTVVSRPPFRTMYWTPGQQLAHLTVNGASLRTGDLFASGTVSGPQRARAGLVARAGVERRRARSVWPTAPPAPSSSTATRSSSPPPHPTAPVAAIALGPVAGRIAPARRMTESSRTVARSLDLLELLATRDDGWSIADLASALGFGRASVYRLLAPFEARGYTRRDPDGRVRLGLAVLALARRAEPAMLAAAPPGPARSWPSTSGATAHLAMREGDEAVAIAVVEPSWTDVHVAYRVGTRHPLGVAASGRALGRAPRAEPTGHRWWTSSGELQTGAHGVAAPVRGLDGVELAIGVISLRTARRGAVGPAVVRRPALAHRRPRLSIAPERPQPRVLVVPPERPRGWWRVGRPGGAGAVGREAADGDRRQLGHDVVHVGRVGQDAAQVGDALPRRAQPPRPGSPRACRRARPRPDGRSRRSVGSRSARAAASASVRPIDTVTVRAHGSSTAGRTATTTALAPHRRRQPRRPRHAPTPRRCRPDRTSGPGGEPRRLVRAARRRGARACLAAARRPRSRRSSRPSRPRSQSAPDVR